MTRGPLHVLWCSCEADLGSNLLLFLQIAITARGMGFMHLGHS